MKNTPSEKVKRSPEYLLWAQGNDNSEQKERLRRNLRTARERALTPRQRQILSMRFEQQMSAVEIARALSLNRSTVSRTLQRACRRLHEVLQYSM